MTQQETVTKLLEIRKEAGTSNYDQAVRIINRMRLDAPLNDRQKRKTFPQSKYRKLYDRCGGVCWWCQSVMPFIRGKIEIDHFDPNAEKFNDDSNLGVLHKDCNREKSSKTLIEQAEYLGITVTELMQRFKG